VFHHSKRREFLEELNHRYRLRFNQLDSKSRDVVSGFCESWKEDSSSNLAAHRFFFLSMMKICLKHFLTIMKFKMKEMYLSSEEEQAIWTTLWLSIIASLSHFSTRAQFRNSNLKMKCICMDRRIEEEKKEEEGKDEDEKEEEEVEGEEKKKKKGKKIEDIEPFVLRRQSTPQRNVPVLHDKHSYIRLRQKQIKINDDQVALTKSEIDKQNNAMT
jgi:hypothetical protein